MQGDEASKLRKKTEKTFPLKQTEISILGPGAIIGDKEVIYKKSSNFDAVVNMDNSVFYEIKGDAFSNLIKYNQTFFKNFMRKTNAREQFRVQRVAKTVEETQQVKKVDHRSKKLTVDDSRYKELVTSDVGEYVRQFTNNLYERNVQSKLQIIQSKQETGEIKASDPNGSVEVENFNGGMRRAQIAEERRLLAKEAKSLKKNVNTGVSLSMETRLVKTILSSNSRLNSAHQRATLRSSSEY